MNDLLERLDDLDDREPFTPSPELLASARRRGRTIRRRRRLGALAVAVPILLLATALGASAYVDHRADEVHRVTTAAGVLAPEDGQPFNVLLVGTDGPRGQAGVRTDAIVVVHVDRAAGKLSLVSVPRDLVWSATSPRIDSVLGMQGPSALIEELESHLDIQISHYVEIDEPGLAALVDHVGGVRVHTEGDLLDPTVGLDLPAGCSTLDGATVVALARSRHLEQRDPATGRVELDATSDLGRELRQRVLLEAIWQELRVMPEDLSSLTTLVDVFADHTTIDAGLSRSELVSLLRWGRHLHESYSMVLPVDPFVAPGGADVLRLDPARAPSIIDTYLGGDAPAVTGVTEAQPPGPPPFMIGLTPC